MVQRRRSRRMVASTIDQLEPGELRGECSIGLSRRVSADDEVRPEHMADDYIGDATGEAWGLDFPFSDDHDRGPPRLRRRTGSA